MAVTIVLVAVTLVISLIISLVSLFSLISCITVVTITAIGCNDATGGYKKKPGNGTVSGKARQRAHRSLQWVID
jgi:hypothetical protein